MKESDTYSLVKTFDNLFEAELAKNLLEQNSIPVELKNEMINSLYPTFAGDMYRLELWVPNELNQLAQKILEDYNESFLTYQFLRQCNALQEGHFLLTSGLHSSYYIEKIRILQSPQITSILCNMLSHRFSHYQPDAIVGPAYGGIVLAFETARIMNIPFFFSQRIDGKMSIRSGFDFNDIKKVVIVEDIVTTGGSVEEVIDCLKQKNIKILAIGSIVDRSGGKINFGFPFFPLLSLDIPSWTDTECELCKNAIPLNKPGRSDKK